MEKINRNEPCPCGSGKKYKKCCGANDAISITDVLINEIDEMQKQLLHFAYYHFGYEINEDFETLEVSLNIENDPDREFYEMIHSIWFSLFEELDDGETIVEQFIKAESGKIKRPKLKSILHTWTDARTIAGRVLAVNDNTLTVEDGFSAEQLETINLAESIQLEEGSFFVGILLPFENRYVFFPAPLELPGLNPDFAISYIEDSSFDADYDSPQEYLTDFFIDVISELPMVDGLVEADALDWPAPIYKEVAELLIEKLEGMMPPPVINAGVILWNQFCQKKQKRIQNPNIYVAALHYLLFTINPLEQGVSQKELAKLYGVSAGSISSIFSEMEHVLADEIAELIEIVYDDDLPFDPPSVQTAPVIEFPKNHGANLSGADSNVMTLTSAAEKPAKKKAGRKVSRRDEERARQLIYDAWQTDGKQRYKLAEEALQLNPNCVDAYVILAEKTKSLEEAILLYEKGIQAGERELGKEFFKENTGYFWGMLETRPFMRAKLHYAEALSLLGKVDVAARQFEELLELNPMDNQGVRYSLFVAYMDLGNFEKARALLVQYDEETAQHLFNKLLLELYEHGFTAKAEMLLKGAKKVNKFVVPYLIGKKRLPAYPPEYYGFGDENEAIVYADMHLHLWKKIDGLKDWLTGK
ncbi:SEC-C metal-binding domain-containing protein [Neobacillus cucumis]|uniref:SEC-C metal-binding domain-containing protein n=1 Tax=Neobacillus cucumis TaxID=1740721 RepID=UPI002852FC67|nr:SEC-C metal-binding domain-containing protein [Neobacillus cucumis]MDR4949452.1 SEC-C metal-binding domain-containing protein [Neobacillus cucumis]